VLCAIAAQNLPLQPPRIIKVPNTKEIKHPDIDYMKKFYMQDPDFISPWIISDTLVSWSVSGGAEFDMPHIYLILILTCSRP